MKKGSRQEIILVTSGLLIVLGGWFWGAAITKVEANEDPGTNVTSTQPLYWAWNDIIGWINFHDTHNVLVKSTKISGWASSSVGEISLDCFSSPNGNICATSNYKVLNSGGHLSGYAWNDIYGWFSFCGGLQTPSCPGEVSYQVTMVASGTNFYFSGYAWNDVVGWVSFDCANHGGCGTNYKVVAGQAYNDEIYYAWNDVVTWIDFGEPTTTVTTDLVNGWASSSVGDISLNCAAVPGNPSGVCGNSNYKVFNDGSGRLSGWGWNDSVGWLSFCGGASTADCPGSEIYRVTIEPRTATQSAMYGYAWNDLLGWISFNCSDPGFCDDYNYKVVTSWTPTSTQGWLESTTFDTGMAKGVQFNSFIWKGDLPAETEVRFQFAMSNSSSGPWNYMGPDGSPASFYVPAANVSTRFVPTTNYTNYRYFRYKIFVESDTAQTATPRVDDVIVNWSP